MTKNLKKINRAYELHQELTQLRVTALWHFYKMGTIVKEIRDNEFWKTLGYDSFEAYLNDPEVSIAVSSAYHAIGIVEMFPDYEQLDGLSVKNAIAILAPVKQGKIKKEKVLEMAKTLSSSDLAHELRQRNLIEASPRSRDIPKLYMCKNCGNIKGVYWEDLCHCGLPEDLVKQISLLIQKRYA